MVDSTTVPIRVLLADDHAMVRSAVRELLKSDPGVEVVGEASDGRAAVRMAAELKPDVVVMDVSMPDLNGIEATRQIRAGGLGPRVVALSAYSDNRLPAETIKAGATGYVLKSAAFEELAAALHTVMAGKVYVSPSITDAEAENAPGAVAADAASSPFNTLTAREREVLQLVAEGKAMKQIAHHLGISIKTVESHRKNLMDKIGIDTVAGLTKYALREGITSLQH